MDWSTVLFFLLLVLFVLVFVVRSAVILEHERGVRYLLGRYSRLLAPGHHWYCPLTTRIARVDIRQTHVAVKGQEVLSKDGVSLRVSVAAIYEIEEPHLALGIVQNYTVAAHHTIQLALRSIMGNTDIDDLLTRRDEIGTMLMELCAEQLTAIGIKLVAIDIKDIMFPGPLKRIFALQVQTRKEAQAALEKARGEAAAMRSLANTARMLDNNPSLMQLRVLQSLGEKGGNTVVLGLSGQTQVLPVETSRALPDPEEAPEADPPGDSED